MDRQIDVCAYMDIRRSVSIYRLETLSLTLRPISLSPQVNGRLWGAGAVLPTRDALTAVTSEGYGEATCATAERLLRLLGRLTEVCSLTSILSFFL